MSDLADRVTGRLRELEIHIRPASIILIFMPDIHAWYPSIPPEDNPDGYPLETESLATMKTRQWIMPTF